MQAPLGKPRRTPGSGRPSVTARRPTTTLVALALAGLLGVWAPARTDAQLDPSQPTAHHPFRPGRPHAPKPFFPTPILPRFVTYWVAAGGPPGCPDDDACLAVRRSETELLELIPRWRHERGLELVRFDALVTSFDSVWAGAWQRSDRRHLFEPDLNWGTFRQHHRRLVRHGYELVSLKLYEVLGRQRMAAIWRPRGDDDPNPARVMRAHDWQQVRREDRKLRRRGFHLSEIEAYPRPDGPDDRWAAGVWRPGKVRTRLLDGLHCDVAHDAPLGDPVPDPRRPGGIDPRLYSRCELMVELEAQAREGFQAVDFESYTEAGEELWAVLLHEHTGPDWLQFAGTELDVDARERDLDASPKTSYTLQDLDIYGLMPFPVRFHNGLVHDGSTSGPP